MAIGNITQLVIETKGHEGTEEEYKSGLFEVGYYDVYDADDE
jgi:hypothetical protein